MIYFLSFFINALVFVFGLCVGSFLNCVIYRLEEKKSLKGRSICPVCKHELLWKDLVPVFSFLFLGRKCRYCRESISWQYPIIELITGFIFLFIFYRSSEPFLLVLNFAEYSKTGLSVLNFLFLAFLFYISSVLIAILFYDLNYYIIPDKILLPAIVITSLYRSFEFIHWDLFGIWGTPWVVGFNDFVFFLSYVFSVLVASGFFLSIFLFSGGKWIGFGDVKLAVLMGLLLAFPTVLVALFLAFLLGSAVGIALMFFKKKNLKSEIPFGPFLIVGTFVALFWGEQIISWYLSFSI